MPIAQMVQDWPALPLSVLGPNTERASGWANTGRRDWSPWPSQVSMGCLLVPGGMSIGEGDMGREGGCPSKGSPLAPHAVFPADAPSTHWTLRTSNRVPNLETKAGRCGQILMDIVSGKQPGSQGEAHKGAGGGGCEWAWAAHATVAQATALSQRGLLGHCPGHTGRVIHQMAVCCLSQLSGDRVKECGRRGRPGRHLFPQTAGTGWALSAWPAGPSLHRGL